MKNTFKNLFGILFVTILGFSFSKVDALTIDQKMGMNGHIDVPKNILYAGGVVREYHNFGWSITSNKQMYFDRFSWWDFDGYYKDLHDHGITILPCIQMGEQTVFNRNRNEKPVMKGADTTDPMSYKIHSNYLFNYAARYGYTKVDESRLNLDPNDTVKTGLGYITYYEDWNEPDKTWQGPDAQFNSTELAAMLSADYDGHEGKLGKNYGVKQADKNAKLVMGGMAGGSTMVKWLTEMQEWAEANRKDKKLPLDVINYHQYAGTHSPENSSFVEDAKKIMEWRDKNASDKEIWITEFGWDTNQGSTKHRAPSDDAQRDWIIREYLIGDRIGLDRMTVYDALNDGPSSDSTQYSTSGLATKVSEGTVKKSSWYGVNTLKYTLKGYILLNVVREDNKMYIYKYTNGKDICYVLWSPTENGSVINNYSLDIGKYTNATLTVLKNKESYGVTTDLEVKNNTVKVNVSESPIFVKVSGKTETAKEETKVTPTPTAEQKKEETKKETKQETKKEVKKQETKKENKKETKKETKQPVATTKKETVKPSPSVSSQPVKKETVKQVSSQVTEEKVTEEKLIVEQVKEPTPTTESDAKATNKINTVTDVDNEKGKYILIIILALACFVII